MLTYAYFADFHPLYQCDSKKAMPAYYMYLQPFAYCNATTTSTSTRKKTEIQVLHERTGRRMLGEYVCDLDRHRDSVWHLNKFDWLLLQAR